MNNRPPNCVQATPGCACCESVSQGVGAPDAERRPLSTAMKATLFLVFLTVLVGCASAPSSAPKAAARWKSVIAALKLYHEEVRDYPKRLLELHPYYLSAGVPLHDEKYPASLRQVILPGCASGFQRGNPRISERWQCSPFRQGSAGTGWSGRRRSYPSWDTLRPGCRIRGPHEWL